VLCTRVPPKRRCESTKREGNQGEGAQRTLKSPGFVPSRHSGGSASDGDTGRVKHSFQRKAVGDRVRNTNLIEKDQYH